MGADYNDILAKLQIAAAQPRQPSFAGLSAPQDPSSIIGVLQKLKQQQYLQSVGQTQGQYGYLHDAGQQAFANVGQQLGTAIGGGLAQVGLPAQGGQSAQGAPYTIPSPSGDSESSASSPPVPVPNAGSTTQQTMGNMVKAATAYEASLLKSGLPADQARVQALSQLVQWGFPGASDKLIDAQQEVLKNNSTLSQTNKDNAQGQSALDEIKNRGFDQQSKTYTTTQTDPNGFYEIQTSGTGEDRRVELKPQVTAGQQALANLSPQGLDYMVQTYKETGNVPVGLSRSPAVAGKFWTAVAQDAAATGETDSPRAILANKMANTANGQALSQTQKQLSQTSSYLGTMNKNIDKARALGSQIDLSDPVFVNELYSKWAAGTSDPKYAQYNIFFDAVTNEYAKIKSGSLGNTAVSDSARREAQSVIQPLLGSAGMNAALDAIKQEGDNRLNSLNEQRDELVGRLQGKKPTADGTPPVESTPTSPTSTPPPGWGTVTKAQ